MAMGETNSDKITVLDHVLHGLSAIAELLVQYLWI